MAARRCVDRGVRGYGGGAVSQEGGGKIGKRVVVGEVQEWLSARLRSVIRERGEHV